MNTLKWFQFYFLIFLLDFSLTIVFIEDISIDGILINIDYDKYIQDDDFTQYISIDKLPTIMCIENNKENFKDIGSDNEMIKNLILNLNPCTLDF